MDSPQSGGQRTVWAAWGLYCSFLQTAGEQGPLQPLGTLQQYWVATDYDMGHVGWSVPSRRAELWSAGLSQHLVLE